MSDEQPAPAYRVLARKYRPKDFQSMIGQEALVRILTNAINSGRIAQAFMLTGVRGVGKTTTARIIAKALNCTGPDGTGGPTPEPCGVCDNCKSIAEDRHVDVQEMDAASRTGVDDIRELIDGVRYRPVAARYKVYVLDEVHMLSRNAFNALLKTLEEPPEHVKFIFATTEIRKVPVTVLSRCQRFDLRRVPLDQLISYFRWICEQEGREVEDEALAMVSRAADGSVRDGLSILDQAIALADGAVTGGRVRDMLGLADRSRVYDLFDATMRGDAPAALDLVGEMYDAGADPIVVLQDMLDVCHWLTRLKLSPELAEKTSTPELERTRAAEMAGKLGMPHLSRSWQMLLKGLAETRNAPSPIQAAEMVIIRLIHAADLPPPGDLVQRLTQGGTSASPGGVPGGGSAQGNSASGGNGSGGGGANAVSSARVDSGSGNGGRAPAMALVSNGSPSFESGAELERAPEAETPSPARQPEAAPLNSYDDLLKMLEDRREGRLLKHLVHDVHLVRFEPGRIDLRPTSAAPKDITNRLAGLLSRWFEKRWVVSVSSEPGQPTVAEVRQAAEQARFDAAGKDPLVQAVMGAFPGAKIKKVVAPEAPEPSEEEMPSEDGSADPSEDGLDDELDAD
ncbi:DNA polymerase III subunit gamma/tau [Hwanghaeella grinnelliae]|uniref:DNA polymerase III subunit gamma/tau n=1 Tax=Hwanghaeella grinnelliae TaxID=2500179 RepID=A0A3S2VQE2_9PROT|nr:DNA polymerase III subunit gamma/tau [Hwanghaeella grinnelliae]RVU36570.1 DNA polymerase III subunit gamma/tau [Hwanghaeella grinnelliae]